MESYDELVSSSRVILDGGNYGFWKSRMKTLIGGIDVLAWRSVLVQWEAPTIVDEEGFRSPKPEETWTEEELKKAKYNSRALSAIHCSVTKKTFELIQGCETAKEAWDLLQTHFEGTTKVQSSRRDMMASRFENMRMEEHESISDFSSRLKSLAQESATLGKKYKDKKLVKKFLRCLPNRFMAYKSALNVSHNTEELSFGEVVGMLQAHEMELDNAEAYVRKSKNLALTTCEKTEESSDEDPMSLLVRRFDRALRKIERGQGQRSMGGGRNLPEGDKQSKKAELQCHECKGYGHFRSECPTLKRREMKCSRCKGVGHTQLECVSSQKQRRERSMIAEEDSEEDSGNEEILNNLVSFVGIMEVEAEDGQSESDSDNDEFVESYREVRETLIKVGQENLLLRKEKQRLEARVESLQTELLNEQKLSQERVLLMKDKLNLAIKAANLEKELCAEKKNYAEL